MYEVVIHYKDNTGKFSNNYLEVDELGEGILNTLRLRLKGGEVELLNMQEISSVTITELTVSKEED